MYKTNASISVNVLQFCTTSKMGLDIVGTLDPEKFLIHDRKYLERPRQPYPDVSSILTNCVQGGES